MENLQTRIVAWADAQPDVRAVALIGSRARRDHPADQWSDYDLILFSQDIRRYAAPPDDWLAEIGTVWVTVQFARGDGLPEHMAVFEGGIKADFAFYPLDYIRRLAEADRMPDAFRRGYIVLLDKDSIFASLPPSPFAPSLPVRPTACEFRQVVEEFWYGVYDLAVTLKRGDLWGVKLADRHLQDRLLQMIEWHTRAVRGWQTDTWLEGRFMREWVDPATWDTVQHVFGRFDAADSWRALWANVDLFRRLATEAAPRLDADYPAALDAHITGFVQGIGAIP